MSFSLNVKSTTLLVAPPGKVEGRLAGTALVVQCAVESDGISAAQRRRAHTFAKDVFTAWHRVVGADSEGQA